MDLVFTQLNHITDILQTCSKLGGGKSSDSTNS